MTKLSEDQRNALFWQALKAAFNWKIIGLCILLSFIAYASLITWAMRHAPLNGKDLELLPPVHGVYKYKLNGFCTRCGVSSLNGERLYCGGYSFFSATSPCQIDPSFENKWVRVHQVLVPTITGMIPNVLKIYNLTDGTFYGIHDFITNEEWMAGVKFQAVTFSLLLMIIMYLIIASLIYNNFRKSNLKKDNYATATQQSQ